MDRLSSNDRDIANRFIQSLLDRQKARDKEKPEG